MNEKLVSNPNGCWKRETPVDCVACYWSHVHRGQWTGPQRCWDAECIVSALEEKKGNER